MATATPELNDHMPEGNPEGPVVERRIGPPHVVEPTAARFRRYLFEVTSDPGSLEPSSTQRDSFRPSEVDDLIDMAADLRTSDDPATSERIALLFGANDMPGFRKEDPDGFIEQVRRHLMAYAGHQYLEHVTMDDLDFAVHTRGDAYVRMLLGGDLQIKDVSARILGAWIDSEKNGELLEVFLEQYTFVLLQSSSHIF